MSGGHGRSYDDYRILPREGGKEVSHARATSVADVLDDRRNLEKWGNRMVALGLAARPDLVELVSVTSPEEKYALNRICDDAKEAAAGSRGANRGNALHKLTERVDSGEDFVIPPGMLPDLDAYRLALRLHGIEVLPEYVERVAVVGSLAEPIAGTMDRLVRWGGRYHVADLKTGGDLKWGWRKIAIQLSIYSRADSFYSRETKTHEDPPEIDRERGIVFHLPAGSGTCRVYLVDLAAGWEAARLAVAVRAWRKTEGLGVPMEVTA